MERAHWLGMRASFLYRARIGVSHQRRRRGIVEPARCSVPEDHVRRRHIHHSTELHRFYTNRVYRKSCKRCGRPNILPVTRCGYCDGSLSDADIRPLGRDVLKELAASRTSPHSRIDLQNRADVHIPPTPDEVCGRAHDEKDHRRPCIPSGLEERAPVRRDFIFSDICGCRRHDQLEEKNIKTKITLQLLPSVSTRQPPSTVEYYRTFDFFIMQYPFPIAAVHLSAVMKGTLYDVKQLRRSHIPLLQRMQRETAAVIKKILQGWLQEEIVLRRLRRTDGKDRKAHRGSCGEKKGSSVAVTSSSKYPVNKAISSRADHQHSIGLSALERKQILDTQSLIPDAQRETHRTSLLSAIEKMTSCMIFGFTYPCEYSQVNMHAIVPPIFNFNMMKAPFFYPLKKILKDLQQSGSVQIYERGAGSWA